MMGERFIDSVGLNHLDGQEMGGGSAQLALDRTWPN